MEVLGLTLAVMPMFVDIMKTVKTAIFAYQREKSLSITNLYVERARLAEFARVLVVVSEGSLTLRSEYISIWQRLLIRSSEKLAEAQLLISQHGYNSSLISDTVKFRNDLVWVRQDEPPRLTGLVRDLAELNDYLHHTVMLHLLQKQNKTDDQSLSSSPDYLLDESVSWDTSLVCDLWSSSVKGLEVIGEKALKSLTLRRTFRRAIVRLNVWRDGFDFDLSDAELVLGTNEDLYEPVVLTLSRLTYFLCMSIYPNGIIPGNLLTPMLVREAGL